LIWARFIPKRVGRESKSDEVGVEAPWSKVFEKFIGENILIRDDEVAIKMVIKRTEKGDRWYVSYIEHLPAAQVGDLMVVYFCDKEA
jgi:hypothetical protein